MAGVKALGESVQIFEVDEPATPAADEVLIDVVAAGIGNWDGVAGADGAIVLSLRT